VQLKQHETAAKCAEQQEAKEFVPDWNQAQEQASSMFQLSTAA